ncbi:MAG: hypothetical protein CME60_10960 [Halobacteriovoraceae bacterium]|nr:hypothetical protein [Halobacteriovoraceae bacterium]
MLKRLLKNILILNTQLEVNKVVDQLLEPEGVKILSFVNAHAVNLMFNNEEFRRYILSSDFLLRDGIGVKIAMKSYGLSSGLNMNGTDFIPTLLSSIKRKRLAVFGTDSKRLKFAVDKLRDKNLVCSRDGFGDFGDYIVLCEKYRPEVILLGMGMPKQEKIAALLKEELTHSCLIINGGAIIDFMSGEIDRAPEFVRSLSLEWFWRLLMEPKRLWRRYLIGNAIFLLRLIIYRRDLD